MQVYDITDKENAFNTLLNLTDANELVLNHYIHEAEMYPCDLMEKFDTMVQYFNIHPTFTLDNLVCNLQHITTSANGCKNIIEHGITDLRTTYNDTSSELRQFLDEHNVRIDILGERIYYNGEDLGSIAYTNENNSSDFKSKIHKRHTIGYKFYNDFCVCGFFSFNHNVLYGGNVYLQPEILFNISELIGKRLDYIWRDTHKCYVVKFRVPYKNLVRDIENEKDVLYEAFRNATYSSDDDKIALLKNNISVQPKDIISIERFNYKKAILSIL